MNPLDLIPAPYRLLGLGVAVLTLAGAVTGAVHHYGSTRYAAGQAEVQGRWTAADLVRAKVAADAEDAARTEEQRRAAAQKDAEDAHQAELLRMRADAVVADAAAGRLQQRVAALLSAARGGQAGGNPQAVSSSAPADDAAGVLAELQRRADERAGVLARIADERGTAGKLCEREFDALTPP